MISLLFASFTVALASSVHTQCDVAGPLPKEDYVIDWNEYNGTWYETVTTMDEISRDHTCVTISDITPTFKGFQGTYEMYFDGGRQISFPIHVFNTGDGHFRQAIVEKKEKIALSQDQSGRINAKAKLEDAELEWEKYAMLGDPRYYCAYVKCDTSGNWVVWVITREKAVSVDELIFIHNDLLKHGVSAPLRLSRCIDVDVI